MGGPLICVVNGEPVLYGMVLGRWTWVSLEECKLGKLALNAKVAAGFDWIDQTVTIIP